MSEKERADMTIELLELADEPVVEELETENDNQPATDKKEEKKSEVDDKFKFVEEVNYNDRIIKTEKKDLPQYEKTHTKEIIESVEEEPTEKKSFLSSVINKKGRYIDYKTRLMTHSLTFIALFILTVIFLQGAFGVVASKNINYNETSNLDYKVYLKENNFYDTNYLGKNKVYIANLIDNIEINFRYNYYIEEPTNVDFNYSIVAKLTIDDGTSKNNYFEKEYELLSNKRFELKSGKNYNLDEKVKIDYAYYNGLANSFKQQYGVDTTSNLTVYLKVNKKTDIENSQNNYENSTM